MCCLNLACFLCIIALYHCSRYVTPNDVAIGDKLQETLQESGPVSTVGVATGYGMDGPGIESRWSEIFRTCPDRPCGLPSLLYNGYRVFSGDPSRTSSAVVKKGWKYTSTPAMRRTACTEPHCLCKGAL
jgi:hypothetical protein